MPRIHGCAAAAMLLLLGQLAAQPTFAPSVQPTINTIGSIWDLAAGDVTGDCLPDLVLTDTGITLGHFFLAVNDGMGGFPSVTWPPSSIDPVRTLVLDVNQDGWNDVVATTLNGQVAAFPNLGNGTIDLVTPLWSDMPGIGGIYQLANGDLDLDGDQDLVLGPVIPASGMPRMIVAYLNNGAGFVASSTVTVTGSLTFAGPASNRGDVQLHDLDGDLLLDLVVLNGQTDDVDAYFNLGSGSFGPRQSIYSGATEVTAMTFADFEGGDGDLDCIVFAGPSVLRAVNQGNGIFGVFTPIALQPPAMVLGQAADFDRDGDFDLLHHSVTPFQPMYVRENTGFSFGPAQQIAFGSYTLRVVDLDLDGYPDVIGYGGGFMRIVRNTSGSSTIPVNVGLASSVNGGPFDGQPKLFAANDTILFGTKALPCVAGRPATIFVNFPPDSNQQGITSLGASGIFPGLTILSPFSTPIGRGYTAGDGLGFYFGFTHLGFGPLHMGDPPFTSPAPPLPPGSKIRLQAVYYVPIPAYFSTFGLVATNAIELTAQ